MRRPSIRLAVSGYLVSAALVLAVATAPQLGAQDGSGTPGPPAIRTPRASQPLATAMAPEWSFAVYDFIDPYPVEELQGIAQPPPNVRYVAAFIEITNPPSSTQQLNLSVNYALRLRDAAGGAYNGGLFSGAEPRLNDRILLPGERAHGWVWWEIPNDARPEVIVFFPPPPEFRVSLPLPSAP